MLIVRRLQQRKYMKWRSSPAREIFCPFSLGSHVHDWQVGTVVRFAVIIYIDQRQNEQNLGPHNLTFKRIKRRRVTSTRRPLFVGDRWGETLLMNVECFFGNEAGSNRAKRNGTGCHIQSGQSDRTISLMRTHRYQNHYPANPFGFRVSFEMPLIKSIFWMVKLQDREFPVAQWPPWQSKIMMHCGFV